jgi:hypothetical protein
MKIQGIVVLSALALSSATFAGNEDGHGRGQGPKFSINVENICTVELKNAAGHDGIFLKVVSTYKDVSGDFDDPDSAPEADVSVKVIEAQQFLKGEEPPKKKYWTQVGGTNTSLDKTVYIDLCDSSPLSPAAKALNASIQVTVDDRIFNSRCDDDPDNNVYDPDTGKVLEEYDESIVLPPVDEDGNPINCPPAP